MNSRATRKAENRRAILQAAAGLLRGKGVQGMSVERAMAGAGLTVGAFYAHFSAKDELLEESFTLALDEIGDVMQGAAGGRTGRAALLDIASTYLSAEHRDRAESGCPMPAVAASAISSGDSSLPHLVARGISTLAERTRDLGGGDLTEERALGLAVLLVGGQILARATRGSAMSSRVLGACREAARALLSPGGEDVARARSGT